MQRRIIPDIVHQQDIISLSRHTSVHDAVQTMASNNIAAIAVTNGEGKLVGIFTERDIARRVFACGHNPQATPLSDVMTENPETLKPNDLALDAIELMIGRNFRHLPVVTEEGAILAMISMRDLLKASLDELNIQVAESAEDAFSPAQV